jgi:hypothetical protein
LREIKLRVTSEDFERLCAMAAAEGVAPAVKGREMMLKGMDPQIFGERYHDVESLLRNVVKKEMEVHSDRLHKRFSRVGGVAAGTMFLVRHVLAAEWRLAPQDDEMIWRECEGRGFKYLGAKQPSVVPDAGDEGGKTDEPTSPTSDTRVW